MKQKRKSKKQTKLARHRQLVQIAEYMVTGGAYFWSGYFLIVFLTPVIGLWWANIVGNTVGVTINFILERYWVFDSKKKRQITHVTGRYLILTGANFILNYYILLGLQTVGIPVAFGQFIASGFFTVWNYLWYRFWVFDVQEKRRVRHHA